MIAKKIWDNSHFTKSKNFMTLPNLNTSNKDLPQTIALDKWADLGFNWQGVITTDDLPRLNKLLKNQVA